jgi:hypothetical protein
VGCLYVKDLDLVDLSVLEEIIAESYRTLTGAAAYPSRAREGREPGRAEGMDPQP